MGARKTHVAGIVAPVPAARLQPPDPPSNTRAAEPVGMVLQRERLHALLDARLPGAVWLHGPTGAGKTMLLRAWLRQGHGSSIWLTADERHRDPAALFAALNALAESLCDAPLPVFSPEHRDEPAAFAARYFERLHRLLPLEHALVVDDVHQLVGATATLLSAAVDACEGRRKLCFASQLLPEAGFARHLASSRLWIIGHRLLAFDVGEARALAERIGSSTPTIDALVAATDGWAAGLMLAMQFGGASGPTGGSDDPLEPVRTPLALLIAGQVLGGASSDDLLRLRLFAELPQVPMELHDVAPAWASACMRLQGLSERGLFVERLSADRRPGDPVEARASNVTRMPKGCWRLHDLFRNALREPGAIGEPDPTVGGDLVTQLLAVERLDLAWQIAARLGRDALDALVVAHGSRALRDPHLLSLSHLAAPHATRAAPAVALWQARALLGNDNAAALDACGEAFEGCVDAGDDAGAALATTLALFVVFATIENVGALAIWVERMVRVRRADLDGFVDGRDDAEVETIRLAGEVVHDLLVGDRASSADAVASIQDRLNARVMALVLTPTEAVLAGSLLVAAMRRLNRLAEVELTAVRIESLAYFGLSAPHIRAAWKVENGYHFLKTGALDTARAAFQGCLELAEVHALLQARIFALIGLVRLELGVGAVAEARVLLDELLLIGVDRFGRQRGLVTHLQARLAAARGELPQALALLDTAERLLRDDGFPATAIGMLDHDRVQLLHARGAIDDSVAISARLAGHGSHTDRKRAEVVAGLLEASTQWAVDPESAQALLATHMHEAESHNLVNFLYLLPALAGRVSAHALQQGVATGFVTRVIKARNLPAPKDAPAAWPWPLRIELLGTFRMVRDGAPMTFAGKTQQKPLELLKFLGCERELTADFHTVTAALWPDADAIAARKSLEVTISRLRKLLGDDSLVIVKEGRVSLDTTRTSSDAVEFLRTSLDAEAVASGRVGAAEVGEVAERLLRLFRALPLENEEPTPWREGVRERFRNTFVRAVRTIATYCETAGDPGRALALLEAAIAREPLAESFYQVLMRAYVQTDRPTEAMRVYRQCRQMLSVLIGAQPSAETERLRATIKL